MTNISTLARLSGENGAYQEVTDTNTHPDGYTEIHFDQNTGFWSNGTGFTAHAYYSAVENTLVIAYAGTDPYSPTDIYADLQLAIAGSSNQDDIAVDFAKMAISKTRIATDPDDFDIVFTGHSLGGFLAQRVAS